MEDLEDYPRVSDSLEGITELSKATILSVVVDYSERKQVNISKRKKCIG